jgi:hypothetical protein
MKLLITRPVVVTVEGGTRSFVPGLTVEVDTLLAQHILDQQAGIRVESDAAQPAADAPNTSRRRKATDAQT